MDFADAASDGTGRDACKVMANTNPCVKPVKLFAYFCALLCPPGGLVLDCFAGSGTTGAAALLGKRRAVLVEREPEYCAIARARCAHAEREALEKREQAETERERQGQEAACQRRQEQPALELEAAGG